MNTNILLFSALLCGAVFSNAQTVGQVGLPKYTSTGLQYSWLTPTGPKFFGVDENGNIILDTVGGGDWSTLTGKPSTFPPEAHNQAISTITGLQAALDGKASTSHNQAWSTITTTPTTLAGYGIADAQPLDADLTALAALTTTTYGRSLNTAADAAGLRTLAGLGTLVATGGGVISTGGSNTLTLGTDPRLTQVNTARPLELNTSGGTVNVFDTSAVGPRLALSSTGGNTAPATVLSQTAATRWGLGTPAASGWVNQHIGAAGAIVGSTTNGSPTNDTIITNSTSTGTGTSTGRIVLATYGSNGTSGTAIGTLTNRLIVSTTGAAAQDMTIGPWASGASHGAVWNSALNGATNYALLQSPGGLTYLNSASGQTIQLCIGHSVIMSVASTGLLTGTGNGIGFNGAAPLTCGLYGMGGGGMIQRGTTLYWQSAGGASTLVMDTAAQTSTFTGTVIPERIVAGSIQIGQNSLQPRIVFIGDSLTVGHGATTPYPASLTIPAWNGYTLTQHNLGVNSYTVALHWNEAHTRINPLYSQRAALNIAVVWLGTNDVTIGGLTPAQTYNQLRAFCGFLKRQGWTVIIGSMISRQNATADGYKNALNPLLAANWAKFADGYAVMPNSISADGAYADTTYFQGDTIHLNNTGLQEVAAAFDAVIDTVVNGF